MNFHQLTSGNYCSVIIRGEFKQELVVFAKNSKYKGYAAGIAKQIESYAQNGLENLSGDQFHEADSSGLFRFRSGKLRCYCYKYENENVLLLTTVALKVGQKTSLKHITLSQKIKRQYEQEKNCVFNKLNKY